MSVVSTEMDGKDGRVEASEGKQKGGKMLSELDGGNSKRIYGGRVLVRCASHLESGNILYELSKISKQFFFKLLFTLSV